ncbi:hypothetical protein L2Y94_14385 [Luteibacter aegosomatis]|uniref:ApeA N-terminal domain 1-containing protein n=1 Tax=Luteibacter aegosomatis TaxID=2911537 RepID=UPI001FF727BF|nr:hypothetical protein [Luteibacter aegosomatis]UPG84519.1 hypothetical protein L2Y94_14385 [Luteibacter aegosomatis]
MMGPKDAFTERQELDVDVYLDDKVVGSGRLVYGSDVTAVVSLRFPSISGELEEGVTYTRLLAKTRDGGDVSLFGCQFHGTYVYVDMLVEGDVAEAFWKICVWYSDVTEWFFVGQQIQGDVGESFTWVGRPEPIEVEVDIGGEALSVSSWVKSRRRHSGDDLVIEERVGFVIEKNAGCFSAKQAQEKCKEMAALLTLLIGHPVDIEGVGLAAEGSHALHDAYFHYFQRSPNKDRERSWPRFLIQKNMLDGRWKAVIENYHASSLRTVTWARMAGMLRYEGFWEYRLIGYISLLDGVVQKMGDGKSVPTSVAPVDRLAQLRKKLGELSEPLSHEQRNQLIKLVGQVYGGGKMPKPTFTDLYRYACSVSDSGVVSVIDISDDDFRSITDMRNEIAHGDELSLPPGGYTRISRVVNKVALLLNYWMWCALGLRPDEILRAVSRTHNPVVLGADINRVALHRILMTAKFYSVTEERFDELSSIKGIGVHACFVLEEDGELQFSEQHTKMLKEWFSNGVGGLIKPEEIFGVSPGQVASFGTAYVECGARHIELIQPYVLYPHRKALDDMLVDEDESMPTS